MELKEFKCPNCGAPLKIKAGMTDIICMHCGSEFHIEGETISYRARREADGDLYERKRNADGDLYERKRNADALLHSRNNESDARLFERKTDNDTRLIREARKINRDSERAESRRNFVHWLFKSGVAEILILILIMAGLFLSIVIMENNEDKAKEARQEEAIANGYRLVYPPINSEDIEKQNYEDIIKQFETAGFENIEPSPENDVKLGLFAKDGQIDYVTIDGSETFTTSSEYRNDSEVVVYYHSK